MTEAGEDLIITGAFILTAGTVISAIGQSTPTDFGKELFAKGNGIEAFGNFLQATGWLQKFEDGSTEAEMLSLVGCLLQASGNTTNFVATEIEIHEDEQEGARLNVFGSGIQGAGAAFEAAGAEIDGRELESIGNHLLAIGALLDSAGGLSKERGEILKLIGSWVQAIGATIDLYAITRSKKAEDDLII